MTVTSQQSFKAIFRVIDAHDHPHGGRILRLRLCKGEALTLSELKGSDLVATPGNGTEVRVKAKGFAVFGGKLSDRRLARSGRVDIHATGQGVQEVDVGWQLRGPA